MQNIEGVPLGTRIVRIDPIGVKYHQVILEPDNVYGVLDLNTVKIPAGYKRAEKDWFRLPGNGEWYLTPSGSVFCSRSPTPSDYKRIILEPIKRTREVLVTEHEIAEFPDYWNGKHQVSREVADIHVKNGSGRIEERPI